MSKKDSTLVSYIVISLILAASYWVAEAVITASQSENYSFIQTLFSPGTHEMWMRSFSGALLLLFLLYVLLHEYKSREYRRFFELLFNHSFDIIIMFDSERQVVRANDAACRALGYSRGELEGLNAADLQGEEEFSNLYSLLRSEAIAQKRYLGEMQLIAKNGSLLPVEAGGSFFIEEGKGYLIGSFRDISDRKEKEEKENELLLSENIFQNTLEGILLTDPEGVIQKVNPGFSHITGYSAEEAIGNTPRMLKSEHHDSEFYRVLWQRLIETGSWEGEIWNRKKSGEAYPEWLSITALRGSNGRIRNYISLFHDITEKKLQEKQLEEMAYHDGLTGLPNRTLLADRLRMAIATSAREKTYTAVLFIDIDDFKNINDSLGHPAGDNLLIQVKERVIRMCREEDTFARYGGDEFILLLPNLQDTDTVSIVASRLLGLFESPYSLESSEYFITASIGVAIYPEDGEDSTTLLKHADLALYNAKGLGKNTYAFFKESLNRQIVRRTLLENELRRALRETDFLLYFQPKMDIAERTVVSMEALLRLEASSGEWVSPEEFIPIAEQTDLILPIGSWVFRTAMNFLREIHSRGHSDITMGVNVSPKQFLAEGFSEEIKGITREYNISPSSVILEITEHILMHKVEYSIEVLRELRELGFKISIDDFGTGYSSLSYLKEFPVSEIKIDRSFIKDLPENRHSSAITRSLIAVARTLDYSIVAEGVETEEHAEFLQRHKCHMGQGYLYSKPVSGDLIIEFIEDQSSP